MPPKNDPDLMPAAADHLPTTVADPENRRGAFNIRFDRWLPVRG
ncbi:hypothetical protein [Desulfosarcina ovata]|nr:hypothetical protein [Desulfosarcina ovata]